ncbi:MAG TPA: RNA polymerase subunit alpha domain protein [Planctomycetaceae bacterium]|nr:RNA polymerase subunit alpha domain protein [Blastopirellula sp.]HAY78801.1 RNA polymerase subunit alpha domain protein [Planctomycetaceae bacterium]
MSQGLEPVEPTPGVNDIVMSHGGFGPNEIDEMSRMISDDYSQFAVLRESVAELETREQTPASAVRLGVCYYIMGRYDGAIQTLSNADGGALAHFYLGKSYFAKEDYDQAISSYESAKRAGYAGEVCDIAIAEAHRYAARADVALQLLDSLFGPIEQTPEYLYQRAVTIASKGDNPTEVCALYERAVEVDGKHPGALFGLALEHDRRGNDGEALSYYQRAGACFPAHIGSLLNLGVMYEDDSQFERAQQCYQRILDSHPDHERARLYFKDAAASGDMYYDEAEQKEQDRLAQVLNVPVTDFELSVRSRNCLQKMGIMTLGDLTRTTEHELLSSKNFGETSLIEIRDMLSSRGLDLGQFANDSSEPEPPVDMSHLSPDEQALMDRPIADLNLSVRARKCMVRLGLTTIGELLRKSGDDLLESKNFGVTSLNEVRDKLTQLNLKLRGD